MNCDELQIVRIRKRLYYIVTRDIIEKLPRVKLTRNNNYRTTLGSDLHITVTVNQYIDTGDLP